MQIERVNPEGLFALDAFGEGIPALLLHLAPAILLLLVVALSWRWPWVGAVVFLALAAFYALNTLHRPDWILAISGPLSVVGVLFLWSALEAVKKSAKN